MIIRPMRTLINTNTSDSSNASSDTTINNTNTLTNASVKDGFDDHHVIVYMMTHWQKDTQL
jgi:hypothetical protein